MWAANLRHRAAQHGLPAGPEGLHGRSTGRHRQPGRCGGGWPRAGAGRGHGRGYLGPLTGGVLGSQYSDIFAFLALILVLTLRPAGLLGERVADRA